MIDDKNLSESEMAKKGLVYRSEYELYLRQLTDEQLCDLHELVCDVMLERGMAADR